MSVHKGKHKVGELPDRVKVLIALSLIAKANKTVKGLQGFYGGRLHGNRTVEELIEFYFGYNQKALKESL